MSVADLRPAEARRAAGPPGKAAQARLGRLPPALHKALHTILGGAA